MKLTTENLTMNYRDQKHEHDQEQDGARSCRVCRGSFSMTWMLTKMLVVLLLLSELWSSAAGEVLMVADEFPAMEVLAKRLKAEVNTESQITDQFQLPKALGD